MQKTILLFLLSIILISCALETKYSLPKDKNMDSKLLGVWHPSKVKGSFIFKANNDQTFSVTMIDEKDVKTMVSTKAYNATINGYKIIVLTHVYKEDSNKKSYTYYGYRVSKNSFNFRPVNEVKNISFKSDEDLLAYFKQNIHKKDFFGDWDEDGFYKD